jgi:hypothetical protein
MFSVVIESFFRPGGGRKHHWEFQISKSAKTGATCFDSGTRSGVPSVSIRWGGARRRNLNFQRNRLKIKYIAKKKVKLLNIVSFLKYYARRSVLHKGSCRAP